MMNKALVLCCLATCLLSSGLAQEFSRELARSVPVYAQTDDWSASRVEMSFADTEISNPEVKAEWADREIKRIDLVFTQYPKDLDSWRNSVETLSAARIDALRSLDASLFEQEGIEWGYVMQNACATLKEAESMFHGFMVYHAAPPEPEVVVVEEAPEPEPAPEPVSRGTAIDRVAAIAYQETTLKDSTAYQVLERHRSDWKRMLVVMDWTGSMYDYGASVLLWYRLNLQREADGQFVFFNDGNGTATRDKVIGQTGGIYRIQTNDIDSVIATMAEVKAGGNGGDGPENDVEALIKGTKAFSGYDEVVLIADNKSQVRDIKLANQVTEPVRVVLCGVTKSRPVHPVYLTLAYKTKGSVHTMAKDVIDFSDGKAPRKLKLDGQRYRLRGGRYQRKKRAFKWVS